MHGPAEALTAFLLLSGITPRKAMTVHEGILRFLNPVLFVKFVQRVRTIRNRRLEFLVALQEIPGVLIEGIGAVALEFDDEPSLGVFRFSFISRGIWLLLGRGLSLDAQNKNPAHNKYETEFQIFNFHF